MAELDACASRGNRLLVLANFEARAVANLRAELAAVKTLCACWVNVHEPQGAPPAETLERVFRRLADGQQRLRAELADVKRISDNLSRAATELIQELRDDHETVRLAYVVACADNEKLRAELARFTGDGLLAAQSKEPTPAMDYSQPDPSE